MKYYLLLVFAVIIGQTFTGCVSAWVFQRKNDAIDYWKALKLYFKTEVGTFMVILTFTILLMFILSDWMDLSVSRAELMSREKLNRFEQAQKFFRTVAILYGVFAQWLAFLFFKGGKKAIDDYGKKAGVDTTDGP